MEDHRVRMRAAAADWLTAEAKVNITGRIGDHREATRAFKKFFKAWVDLFKRNPPGAP